MQDYVHGDDESDDGNAPDDENDVVHNDARSVQHEVRV